MALLDINGIKHAEFWFNGDKRRRSTRTGHEPTAQRIHAAMEARKQHLELGIIPLPAGVSHWDYIFEGKKEAPVVVDTGSALAPVTISELVEQYKLKLMASDITEGWAKTQCGYLGQFERFLEKPPMPLPELITEWKKKHLEAYRSWRLSKAGRNKQGRSVRAVSVNKELGAIGRMFDDAVDEELLKENPARKVKPLSDDTPDDEWLTSEEVEAKIRTGNLDEKEAVKLRRRLVPDAVEVEELKELCWSAAEVHYIDRLGDLALFMNIAADIGARFDEIFRLKKKDITLDVAAEKGSITVYSRKQSRNRTWTSRTIPIPGELVIRLVRWLAETSGERLFADKLANTFRKQVYEKLDLMTAGSKFHGLRPHLLRHACRTNWHEGGIDEAWIDKYLGHTTKAMAERYRHLREKRGKDKMLEYRRKVEAERAQRADRVIEAIKAAAPLGAGDAGPATLSFAVLSPSLTG